MRPKKTKHITIVLAIILSFFLGRESKGFNTLYCPQIELSEDLNTPNFLSKNNSVYKNSLELNLKLTDTVYRCGQSKIYHPTITHGSFKLCKSKVYKLTIKRAKELGMRHCKCSN